MITALYENGKLPSVRHTVPWSLPIQAARETSHMIQAVQGFAVTHHPENGFWGMLLLRGVGCPTNMSQFLLCFGIRWPGETTTWNVGPHNFRGCLWSLWSEEDEEVVWVYIALGSRPWIIVQLFWSSIRNKARRPPCDLVLCLSDRSIWHVVEVLRNRSIHPYGVHFETLL